MKRTGRRATRRNTKRGLTLVEVIGVLVAIAVLIGVAVASWPPRSRDQAKRVYCASNLKQLGEAWHQYLAANKGRFLQGVNANINFGGKQGSDPAYGGDPNRPIAKPLNAHLTLPPVTAEAKMFRCPSDHGGGNVRDSTYFDLYGSSYGTNTLLIGQNQAFWPGNLPCGDLFRQINQRLTSLNESHVSTPHKLILLGDAGWLNAWHPGSTQRIEWHQRPQSHNIAFMDGHVEFVRVRKGIHTCDDYTVIPWRDLQEMACGCQVEILP